MKMRNYCVVWLMIAAMFAVGCGGPTEVQLGAILSLEGAASSYGTSIQRGIVLAVEKVNADGGVFIGESDTGTPLIVTVRDAASDPQIGAQVAREMLETDIQAVIGSDSSDVTLAIADLFQQAEVVLLSPSSSTPELNDKGDYIYRNFPSDEFEAVNTANHIYNVADISDVLIISSQSEFGLGIKRAFIERFRMLGGSVENQVSFPADSTDVADQVQELLGYGDATGVYIAGYSAETATAARALREAGIDLPLFGTGAILADELSAAGGDAVEGLVFPTPAFDPEGDGEILRQFVAAYRAKYGEGVDVYAAHGYDAVLILVQAIEQEGLRAQGISFYLNAMSAFPGAAGETTFNEDGNAVKFHRMFVIQDGQMVPITG